MTKQTPRPRLRRKEARPQEIIEAAFAEFTGRGFATTRLEDVAARAGVSKATIYVYFKDKEELFQACMRSRITPLAENAEAMLALYGGSTQELLRLIITMIYEGLVKSGARELLRIIIAESPRFPFLAELHHRETVTRARALLTRVVARGTARGEFREGDYAGHPIVIAGPALLATLWMLLFQTRDPIDMDKMAAAHIDLVLNGVMRRPD